MLGYTASQVPTRPHCCSASLPSSRHSSQLRHTPSVLLEALLRALPMQGSGVPHACAFEH
jgi:hypothetical protein